LHALSIGGDALIDFGGVLLGLGTDSLGLCLLLIDNGPLTLETSVTGTVSLEAEKKGINMSRIMRSFYAHAERDFSFGVIEHALEDYKRDLGSFDARIQMRFSFPVKVASLRSGLSGWQYYDIALELVDKAGVRKRLMHLDFVYSSTCPCSMRKNSSRLRSLISRTMATMPPSTCTTCR